MDRLVPLEGQQETQDLLETLGQKAHLDHPAIRVLLATQDQKDLQEAPALQVHQGQKTAW